MDELEQEPNTSDTSEKEHDGMLQTIYDFTELFAIAATIILLLFTLLTRLSVVSGGSMKETLHNGDRLLVSDLFYTPAKNDIVVIQFPYDVGNTVKEGSPIVKRIVAVAGDTVEIRSDGVYVNGNLANGAQDGYSILIDGPLYWKEQPPFVVPDGTVFVLGDHRNNSFDSRYFGVVDARYILGRAYFRIMPFDDFGPI